MSRLPLKTSCALLATTAGFLAYKYITSKVTKLSKCIVIENVEDWNRHESEIISVLKHSKVIGLDCEWVNDEGRRNSVSLLQLANNSGYCILIRLCCLPVWLIPEGISNILLNENILKVGVGIYDDANKLFEDYGLEVRGFIDLRFLANDLEELREKNLGLKSLSHELLNIDLNKSKRLRCSDWDAPELTDEQIKYASEDVIVAAQIFFEIKKRKTGWFSISTWNFIKEITSYMNLQFKQKYVNSGDKSSSSRPALPSRSNKSRYSKPRQKPMYDNCQLVAPDGEILCSCDKGKAEWYVMKGLGEVVCQEPFTVRLNFEPSGRPTLDNIFYTKEKSNCCVVCGKADQFHRKLVIPSEYRKFFPNLMKKNLSHDVILLCVNCHKRSNIIDQTMRQKLADLCDAPLGCRKNVKFKSNPELIRVKSAATAIYRANDKLPETRRTQLEQTIKDYFKVSTVDEDTLAEALNVDVNMPNDAYIAHGQKVYEYFCKNGGLMEFERMWRQHFLDTMQPKYLPSMWSIDHNHKRLAMQVINHEREIDFDTSILGINSELIEEIKSETSKQT
ncbi:exonuclease 3'-5' domain-containing protein 2 [Parasteatoda tepidariorum]|uniref:exonuclease 3'-5' domain-containing protein 2 n=1 Tax=Parasteatoda tepidariorum TaxID=114398 RepID=UPI00077F85BA|nr:exonuclease 3'-5' domain-containing protein 2 [Parasteatoda tepidariorum]